MSDTPRTDSQSVKGYETYSTRNKRKQKKMKMEQNAKYATPLNPRFFFSVPKDDLDLLAKKVIETLSHESLSPHDVIRVALEEWLNELMDIDYDRFKCWAEATAQRVMLGLYYTFGELEKEIAYYQDRERREVR